MIETIKFEIVFDSQFDNIPPSAEVYVDNELKWTGLIDSKSYAVEFAHTLDFSVDHQLSIKRGNKSQQHNGQDQLLTLTKLKIDGVDIRNIVWSQSWNEPQYPEPWASQQRAQGVELEERVIAETCWGHNGTWRLNFTSPFYRFIMNWMG